MQTSLELLIKPLQLSAFGAHVVSAVAGPLVGGLGTVTGSGQSPD